MFDIPFMYIANIGTDEGRVKFVAKLLHHKTFLKLTKDQTIINANGYYETFINGK